MSNDEIVHWVAGVTVPGGAGLFIFLLKRAFNDFEGKIAKLFGQMEKSLEAQQAHSTQIQLIAQRLTTMERLSYDVSKRCEVHRAARPAEED